MKPSQRRPVFASVPGKPHLKVFVGFEGDPGTIPRKFQRSTGLGGLGHVGERRPEGFPLSTGAPGSCFPGEYSENEIWGTPNNGPVTAPIDPSTPIPHEDGLTQFDPGISLPFGVSVIRWKNPTTFQSVPILASTSATVPVLSLNMDRNALLIQNNSTATAPDVAPTFFVGFNAQPQAGLSLAVLPLSGILFDIITPRDSIYILIAGGSGVSQIIQGAIVQGTYAPI
jgi:hypothetical protein